MRSKVRLLFMTCAVLLAIPAIALADNAVADGDGVTPLTDNPTMAFGNVGCNVASTNKALIAISRNGAAGSTNVFANGSTVTVTASATGDAALSAAMDSSTITLSPTWSTATNNTLSDSVLSTVTVNDSTAGPGLGTVTYTATGKNTAGATINRTDTVNVTWTTGSCDTQAPSVSSIAATDANPTNTTNPLHWKVTFSENVTGVDASDFNLANDGLGGSPTISSVAQEVGNASVYNVTASSGSGTGKLGLNLTDNDSIKDAANNPLGGTNPGNGDFTGDIYTIDRAAPTMTGSAVLGPDFTDPYTADTWTNQSVRVTFTCADTGGSGLTSGSGNNVQNFTTETSGATATSGGTCTDNAGNTAAAATFGPIKIDKTNPTISSSADRMDGTTVLGSYSQGTWTNKSVRVSFSCNDALSGVNTTASDIAGATLNGSGENQSVSSTGSCVDQADNTNSGASYNNIDIDKDNPTISGAATPAPNAAGWNNTNVTVNFTCGDDLSGIASCGPNQTLSTEGTGLSASGTATDNATNSANATVSGIKIDKTKPSVTVTGVSNGGAYTTGNVPTPGCNTTDGTSGVKTSATLNVAGGTGGFGTLTATCSGAEDNAGNTNSASATYTVSAAFNGFLQPIDGHSVNTGKYGRTYPIKWQLRDSSGALISDTTAQLLVGTMTGGQKAVSCTSFDLSDSDALEESTTGNTSLRYDATSDQFIYNYKAPTSGTCYVFAIRNADGLTTQQIDFQFTK